MPPALSVGSVWKVVWPLAQEAQAAACLLFPPFRWTAPEPRVRSQPTLETEN